MLRLFLLIFPIFIFENNCFSQEIRTMTYHQIDSIELANHRFDSISQVKFSKMNLKKIVSYLNNRFKEFGFPVNADCKGNIYSYNTHFNIKNVEMEAQFSHYPFGIACYCKNRNSCIDVLHSSELTISTSVTLLPNSSMEIDSNRIWEVAKEIEVALKHFQK
jgi:hypothetical protein